MKAKKIIIKRIPEENQLKAVASVLFDNNIVIHDIKIIKKENSSYCIAMPSRKIYFYSDDKDGFFFDTVFPITVEARKSLENQIIDTYLSGLTENFIENNDADINITSTHFEIPKYPNLPKEFLQEVS